MNLTAERLFEMFALWMEHHTKTDPAFKDKQITWIEFGAFIRWIQKSDEAALAEFEKDPLGNIMKQFGK